MIVYSSYATPYCRSRFSSCPAIRTEPRKYRTPLSANGGILGKDARVPGVVGKSGEVILIGAGLKEAKKKGLAATTK